MKKWLLGFLCGVCLAPNLLVARAVDLNNVVNEADFRTVLSEFAELPAVASDVVITNATQETFIEMVYDANVAGMRQTTAIPAGDLTTALELIVYVFDNGIEVTDMAQLLASTVEWTSQYDPNYQSLVEQVVDAVAGRLVKTETPSSFSGFHLQPYHFFLNPDWQFSQVNIDGERVRANVDLTAYLADHSDEIYAYYPEGTQFALTLEVDRASQTLKSVMVIDIDEELQKELYGGQVNMTLQGAMTDTAITSTYQASDETIPALEDLPTMPLAEYEELVSVLE